MGLVVLIVAAAAIAAGAVPILRAARRERGAGAWDRLWTLLPVAFLAVLVALAAGALAG